MTIKGDIYLYTPVYGYNNIEQLLKYAAAR